MSVEMLAWLSVWNKMQAICIWSSWCHCHPIISCFIKIQIGLTFLLPAYPGCLGKEAVFCRKILVSSVPKFISGTAGGQETTLPPVDQLHLAVIMETVTVGRWHCTHTLHILMS